MNGHPARTDDRRPLTDRRATAMAQPRWNGRVAVDIRDSEPDWAPFVQPRAPQGAPNVL